MLEELRRVALFTSGVAELSRDRAEKLVKRAVKSGEVRASQASSMVKNLMDASRQNRKELLGLIRSELQDQLSGLRLASHRDMERLERRVDRLDEKVKKLRSAGSKTTKKKTTGSKTAS